MDKETKEKWVAALRSGEYRQGFDKICTRAKDGGKDMYCAYGVAYHCLYGDKVFHKNGTLKAKYSGSLYKKFGNGNHVVLHMNDIEKRSFAEIADYIEANL